MKNNKDYNLIYKTEIMKYKNEVKNIYNSIK